MRLYHYTSEEHLKLILKQGITRCVIPWAIVNHKTKFATGMQWLTESDSWDQDWARPKLGSRLPYRKNEYRITISIPHTSAGTDALVRWDQFCRKYTFEGAQFCSFGNETRHWWLFRGQIKPGAFIAIDRNPTPLILNLNDASQ